MIPTFITDKSGNVLLNPVKNFVKGTVLAPASTAVPVATAAKVGSNAGATRSVILQAPTDGAIELFSFMGQQSAAVAADITNRYRATIQETGRGMRQLMNRSIPCNHLFGTPGQPHFLTESIFLEPDQTLNLSFFNHSASGVADFYFAMEGRKFQTVNVAEPLVDQLIRKNRQEKDIFYPFWLTSQEDITLSANGNGTAYFNNTKDQWMVIWYAMATAISSGVAGDTVELFTAEILDPRTNRPLQNQPFTLNTGFGSGSLPYRFPTGWLIEPESQIQVNLKNLVTDATTDVFITFHGQAAYSHEIPSMSKRIYDSVQWAPPVSL